MDPGQWQMTRFCRICVILIVAVSVASCGYSDREECLREELSGEVNEYAAKLKAKKCVDNYELKNSTNASTRIYQNLWSQCVSYQFSAAEERSMVNSILAGGFEALSTPELEKLSAAHEKCPKH